MRIILDVERAGDLQAALDAFIRVACDHPLTKVCVVVPHGSSRKFLVRMTHTGWSVTDEKRRKK